MALKIVTPATGSILTLQEAKDHLRVTESTEDTLILSLVQAATEHAQVVTKKQFLTATYDLCIEQWPYGSGWYIDPEGWAVLGGDLLLPRPPLQSVTWIHYVDGDGVTQTVPASTYCVDVGDEPGRIWLAYNQSWPSYRVQREPITIRFIAGYGAHEDVPETIKSAVKLHVGWLYENRESAITGTIVAELPFSYRALLSGVRNLGVS